MRKAVGVVIIRDGKILLVQKNKTWILPGGKPEPRESDLECLSREISQELPLAEIEVEDFYNSFTGIAPHKKDEIEVKVYFGVLKNSLISPGAEISKSLFTKNFEEYNVSDVTKKIIDSLRQDNYLK